ncbi:hypothetical protein OIO90_002594 [Microbotryomycetes sp. JL221]|nr:hypothetical protein OIO90_002594 [Microbotryomycetes sp. JL221]
MFGPSRSTTTTTTVLNERTSTPQRSSDLAKPIKLDTKYGPGPCVGAKFRNAERLVEQYRAYQWTKGFDLVAHWHSDQCILQCADRETYACPFSISTRKTLIKMGPSAEVEGFIVVNDYFSPNHNHDRPYEMVDLDLENERRIKLYKNDPSLQRPPSLKKLTTIHQLIQQQQEQDQTLVEFLKEIDPFMATEEILNLLDSNDVPRNHPSKELLELDDETLYNVFASIQGLSTLYPFRVVSAVQRARRRHNKDQEDAVAIGDGPVKLDPKHEDDLKTIVEANIQAALNKARGSTVV